MADSQQSVEHMFCTALDLPPEQRNAYLDRVCGGDAHLRRLVDDLLHDDVRAGSFLAAPLMHPSLSPAVVAMQAQPAIATPSGLAQLIPNQLIAGRFVVIRFIARGGMGEVYEVQDTFLQNESLALKMIRPEIAADAATSHRFQQEVVLARKVVHPNLCPIYDIFRNEDSASSLFLTMRLLRGETLDAYLRRSRRLAAQEAEHVSRELIAGVAAMHAAGVIHRDLKPNNVMLERSGDMLRVVIMDFGLARLHESEFSLLGTGMVAGTPGYLAPELFHGQQPTQATDIFALGVVLHQVLAGERPIEARDNSSQHPSSSLDHADVSPSLIAAVKSFLSASPEQRCIAFDSVSAASQLARTLAPRPLMTRRAFAVSAGASTLALAGGAAWKRQDLYNFLHPLPNKRFVALLTWPPPAEVQVLPMLTSLIDTMADELSRAEAFDRNFFIAAGKDADLKTPAQMNEIRESLGANLVLATSGRTDGSDVRVRLHVLDPASGRTLRSRDIHAGNDEVVSLPARVVRAAAELLDVARFQGPDRNGVGTENPKALAAFQQADLLRDQENDKGLDGAITKYKEALEIDPHYAEAQAKLAWAYMRLYGLHGQAAALVLARENCEAALRLKPDLVTALVGRAWLLQASGDQAGAAREMTKALSLDPSNVSTLTYQAQFYADDGQYAKAEEAYRRAVKLRPNLWYVHNELGSLLDDLGRYSEALVAFQTANEAAPKNALALSNIAFVHLQLGNLDQVIKNAQISLALEPNDWAFAILADAFRIEGRFADALRSAQKAVDLNPSPANWIELGDCNAAAGQHTAAMNCYRSGLRAQEEELRNQPKSGAGWMMLAFCRARTTDTVGAGIAIDNAERNHGDDLNSQLLKIRVLELLGRRQDALNLTERCISRGATRFELETMPDVQSLRADPRFPRMSPGAVS